MEGEKSSKDMNSSDQEGEKSAGENNGEQAVEFGDTDENVESAEETNKVNEKVSRESTSNVENEEANVATQAEENEKSENNTEDKQPDKEKPVNKLDCNDATNQGKEVKKETRDADTPEEKSDYEKKTCDIESWECLGKGVKKESSCQLIQCKRPTALLSTDDSKYIVLDVEENKIYILDAGGSKQKGFQYLYAYVFQGGLSLLGEDQILVALKNEKYSSVSFYKKDGKFKFSAFLKQEADIPSLAVNSLREIVCLDSNSKSISLINQEKSLHKTVNITSHLQGHNSALTNLVVSSHDHIYILDEICLSILVFDKQCELKRTFSLEIPNVDNENTSTKNNATMITVGEVKQSETDEQDNLQTLDEHPKESITVKAHYKMILGPFDTLIVLDKTQRKVHLFSLEGKYGLTIVQYEQCIDIADISCTQDGHLSVMLSRDIQTVESMIMLYKFSVAKGLRGPKKPVNKGEASKCCTIL